MTYNDQEKSSSKIERKGKEPKRKSIGTHDLIVYISQNAVVAAIYFVMTVFTQPISFGAMQIRLSEALGLLCFWRPDFAIGMTLGCFLANTYSFSPWDMLLGTLATLLSSLLISYVSKRLLVACLWPVLINGLVIGLELTYIYPVFDRFYLNAGYVALGEAGAILVGYAIWMVVRRLKFFEKVFKPTLHQTVRW